jgi:hypothetical protein
VPEGQAFTNNSPHLLGKWCARFPNILCLADRAAKRFGDFPDLNVYVRLILHCSEKRERSGQKNGEAQCESNAHQDVVVVG